MKAQLEEAAMGRKILFIPVLCSGFIALPIHVQAGTHSQSTHSTPKGYHHDGTVCFEAHPEALLLFVGLFLAFAVMAVAALLEQLLQFNPIPRRRVVASSA